MIIFESLGYRNFLSSGTKEITIDFLAANTTLVVGANGAGKSTMLDALSFVLFGKPHRNIKKPQLVNSINQKGCLVWINFRIGNVVYKIVRGMKPNIFEIWQNGILMNQDSHTRDYQRFLETNILKLNHKSFHQVVVLGAGNFIPFMQLIPHHRRGVIEDLLDISIFSKMNVALKEKIARLKDSLKETENELRLVNEKVRLQENHLASLKEIDLDAAAKQKIEIDQLLVEIEVLEKTNAKLQEEYDAKEAKARNANEAANAKHTSLVSMERQIHANMGATVKDAKFYEQNDECPTCRQGIGEELKTKKLHDCRQKAAELKTGWDKIKASIAEAKKTLKTVTDAYADVASIQQTIRVNQQAISASERRIATITRNASSTKASGGVTDSAAVEAEVAKLKSDRNALYDLKAQQSEEKTYNDIIAELLKDTGIKTKIIAQYLPVMNKLINQYLQILDFFVSFHLDENFNETIRSRHRDDFSYTSFSEGEKARIDLALLFSWRQIAKMKNSANTNLLILDETFDSSVDGDGIENLLKILNSFRGDTKVFVISHKQDLLDGKFDRKVEFEKVNSFSRIRPGK